MCAAAKRLWAELLRGWAPLYAEPRFVPEGLRADFTAMMGIPVFDGQLPRPYSILNDPDTGIRLPGAKNQREGRLHIAIPTIVEQLHAGARCVVTFDQSVYRQDHLDRRGQHQLKMQALREHGCQHRRRV